MIYELDPFKFLSVILTKDQFLEISAPKRNN